MMRKCRKITMVAISLIIGICSAIYCGPISNATEEMSISYNTHIQNIGWEKDYSKSNGAVSGTEGQALRLEAIKIRLNNAESGISLKYQVHVQNIGWQDWKSNREAAGTQGQALRLEAIKIKLEGTKNYKVQYRTHVQNIGWQNWQEDGEISGTEGLGLRLEAIQIRIVKIDTPTVEYNSHISQIGWESNYSKVNGQMSGTTGRSLGLEAIKIKLNGVSANANIQYQAHVSNIGWQGWKSETNIAGTTGRSLHIEAIRIKLNNLPGYSIKYRAHVQGIGWQDWKTDGNMAGTVGLGLRIEAIQIQLVRKDSTSPTIKLNGNSTVNVNLGSKYIDQGATATDNIDGNITSKIETKNNVNTSKIGTYKVTYTVKDTTGNTATKTRTVNVKDYITSIEVTPPTKLIYNYNENLNLTGMVVKSVMKSGAKNVIANSSCTVTGYNKNKLGKQIITVTYNGKSATFKVNVNDYITGIEITTQPSKLEYKYDEDLNLTGMVVKSVMKSGIKNVISNSSYTVTGYNKTTLGTQTITVSYNGKSSTFNVNVSDYINKIEITTQPSKLEYKYNEDLDLTGMIVKEVMKSGTKNIVANSSCTVIGYNKTTLGTQTITVSYNGKSSTFNVNVNNYITGIEITTEPSKTQYIEGENIDLTGLVVKAIMGNNEKIVITDSIISNPSNNISYGKEKVEISYVTTNTINGESATFTEEFPITVKKVFSTLVVNEEKDNGYAHEKFTYGTISSGVNEEDVNITDLKYQVKNSLGIDITNQLVEGKKIVDVTFEEELLRPGEILIKVTAEQLENYTIIPYIGTSVDDTNTIKAAEQQIEISYNPIIATAEILDFTNASVRVEKVIIKDIKFKNAHGDELTNITNSQVQISGTGTEITLLDEDETPGSIVRKIQIKGTTQGTTTINAILNKGTTNQTQPTSIGTITVQARSQKSLNMEEIETITLLQQEPLTTLPNVIVENEVPYTLIPIGLIDEDNEESKIKGNQLTIGDPTVTNPFGVKYTGYDQEELISLLDVKMFKNGSSVTTAVDADYVGIALANGTTKSDLEGRKLILKYGLSEVSIGIVVEDLRISNLIITPENIDSVSNLPTIENHIKTTIGSIQAGDRQKELTIADLSYKVKNSIGTDITNNVLNNKKVVNVTFEEEVARPGEILIKVETQQEGNYTIIPYITVQENEVTVEQKIESINNPIINTAEITGIHTTEMKVERTFENTIVLKNIYGDILQGVKANTISVTATGLNITLLNNGNPIANQEENVTGIQIVPQNAGNKTISIVVNKNTEDEKTITINNVNILPNDITLSVNNMTKVYLYELEPQSSTYTICNIDGVIYTLIPVSLSDGTKLKGNSLVIGNAQDGKLSLNISNDDTWSIDAKMFKNQTTVAQAAEDATYVGIALGAGYTEEELLGNNITLTYETSTKTLSISK